MEASKYLRGLFDSQTSKTEVIRILCILINLIKWIPRTARLGAPELGIDQFYLLKLGL